MYKSTKTLNKIEAFPWGELNSIDDVPKFLETNKLKARSWFLEQMLAHISRWPLVKIDDKIDGEATVKNAVRSSELNRGLWFLAMHERRGDLVDKQNSLGASFSALVPLILAAHKRYSNIEYSRWTNTKFCFDPQLQAAIDSGEKFRELQNLGSETLLKILNHGLVVQTGPKAGEQRSARSSYNIYNLKAVEYGEDVLELPHLARVMLLQFWLAHPTVRNKYMILDPNNWDVIPVAHIPELELSGSDGLGSVVKKVVELPWD